MPVQPDPQAIQGWPNQVNIPTQDQRFFLSIQVQTDGTPSQEDQDQFLQELIDYFQEWPGRHPNLDVTGSRYQSWLYLVTPTNPIPPPPPPEEEPVNP
jgi:hypothetical protein